MKSLFRRRPSPALVIALIALFVSLSGVSYGVATGFIDSREIKNNEVRSLDIRNNEVRTRDLRNNEVRGIDIRNSTVRGQDVGLNTLGGLDINESTLDKVPSATSADTADSATTAGTATSANSVGGLALEKVDYVAQTTDPYGQVFNVGGLLVEARCQNAGTPAVEIRATPAVPNSELVTDVPTGFPDTNDTDFDSQAFIYDGTTEGPFRIDYFGSDGRVVRAEGYIRLEPNGVRGTTNDCGIFGVAAGG